MKNENIQLVLLCPVYEVQLDESLILSESYMNEKWEFKEKEKERLNLGGVLQKEAGWLGEGRDPVPHSESIRCLRGLWIWEEEAFCLLGSETMEPIKLLLLPPPRPSCSAWEWVLPVVDVPTFSVVYLEEFTNSLSVPAAFVQWKFKPHRLNLNKVMHVDFLAHLRHILHAAMKLWCP